MAATKRKGRPGTAIPMPAGIFEKFTAAEDIAAPARIEAPAWPVRLLAARHSLTIHRARLVLQLAYLVLGGEVAR